MSDKALKVALHVDGGARGNPGPAAAGVVICGAKDDAILYEAGLFLGPATNNVAEYSGLVAGLKAAAALQAGEVDVYSDSQLLVRQMRGEYRVKNAHLKPYHQDAGTLARKFARCDFHHISREQNLRADGLVNMALDCHADVGDAAI